MKQNILRKVSLFILVVAVGVFVQTAFASGDSKAKILPVSPYSGGGFFENKGQLNAYNGQQTPLYFNYLNPEAQVYFFPNSFSYVFTQPVQSINASTSSAGLN